jgi:hypothetical protein
MSKALLVVAVLCAVVGLAALEKDHDTGVSMVVAAAALGLLSVKSVRESLSFDNLTKGKVIFIVALLILGVAMFKFGPVTVVEKITTWVEDVVEGVRKGQNSS